MNAENKLFAELTKAELANAFVSNAEKIAFFKAELKKLETENSNLEAILLPQIGLKYQPKGAKFILMPKQTKGRKSTSYAKVVDEAPNVCKFTNKQITTFKDLISTHTNFAENKTSIEIKK